MQIELSRVVRAVVPTITPEQSLLIDRLYREALGAAAETPSQPSQHAQESEERPAGQWPETSALATTARPEGRVISLANSGLSPAEARVAEVLAGEHPLSSSQMASKLKMDRSQLAKTLKRLEDRKVVQSIDPEKGSTRLWMLLHARQGQASA